MSRKILPPHWTLVLLLLASFVQACTGGQGDESNLPAGTLALVDGTPILASEVDQHVDALLSLQPAFTVSHRRRLILTHCSIPMAFGIAHAGERRAQALADAEAWVRGEGSRVSPADVDALGVIEAGRWNDIGLETWLIARTLDPGQSSGIVELAGRYAVIEMQSRDRNPKPAMEKMELSIQTFPYDATPMALMDRCLAGTLQIIDPAWDNLVPARYKYSMRGAQ